MPAESGLQLPTRPRWFIMTIPSRIQMTMASNVTTEIVSIDSLVLNIGLSLRVMIPVYNLGKGKERRERKRKRKGRKESQKFIVSVVLLFRCIVNGCPFTIVDIIKHFRQPIQVWGAALYTL